MAEKRSNQWEIILYEESLPEDFKDIIEDTKVACILSPLHNMDKYTKYDERRAIKQINDLSVRFLEVQRDKSSLSELLETVIDKRDSVSKFNTIEKLQNKIISLKNEEQFISSEIDRLNQYREGEYKKLHFHLLCDFGEGANKSVTQIQEIFCDPLNAAKFPRIVNSQRGAVRYLIHMDHPDKAQYRMDEVRCFNGYNTGDFFDISNRDLDNLSVDLMEFVVDNNIHNYADLERVTRCYRPFHKYVCSHSVLLTSFFKSYTDGINEDFRKEKDRYICDLQSKLTDLVVSR